MKKIMFNDRYGLTQAVLEGRKTMTRRIVPQAVLDEVPAYQAEYYAGVLEPISTEDAIRNMVVSEGICKAPYQIGEVVAVAQAYKDVCDDILTMWGHKTDIAALVLKKSAGWKNKMFVRADYMPHQIRITNIRVERLQDISDEDCIKEGLQKLKDHETYSVGNVYYTPYFINIRAAFSDLIDRVSGKGTWDKNPLVFVYEFELIK